jgi:hypothetical protein
MEVRLKFVMAPVLEKPEVCWANAQVILIVYEDVQFNFVLQVLAIALINT